MDDPYLVTTYANQDHFRSILRIFDTQDAAVPVDLLCQHLKRHPRLLHSLNPTKVEEVVGSVFADFFACEVKHVGRTGDGGIDLLVISSDNPIAVQVKRRIEPRRTEGVSLVREFLGAIQLAGFDEGILVSTADSFTKGAVKAAELSVSRQLLRKYQLVDFHSLVDMLGLAKGSTPEPLKHLGIRDWADPTTWPPPEPLEAQVTDAP